MPPKSQKPRVLAIYKKSAYQIYIRERKNPHIARLIGNNHGSVENLRISDQRHRKSIEEAKRAMADLGASVTFRYRGDAASTRAFDLVITLGGDGTFLWASHHIGNNIPLLGLNTAPLHSVGHFCAGGPKEMRSLIEKALQGNLRKTSLNRMSIKLDGKPLFNRVINEALFCHESPAATSRYMITRGNVTEDHKSSGVLIGPAAGSTAARKSAGAPVMRVSSKRLHFLVREPYQPPGLKYKLTKGYIGQNDSLYIQSRMRPGVLYLDGPRMKHVVEIGSSIEFSRSDEPLQILGYRGKNWRNT